MLPVRILAVAIFAAALAAPASAEKGQTETTQDSVSETSSAATAEPSSETQSEAVAEKAVKPQPRPRQTLVASINLTDQTMTVKVNGSTRYSWPISSGVAKFATPTGTFHPQWTAKSWFSRKYDMAPMPHSVFIHGGIAIHGTTHVRSLGRAASHGCIRLAPSHARTFYNLVQSHGMRATKVSVYGRPNWNSGAAVASRDVGRDRENSYAGSQSGNSFWGDSWGNDNSTYVRIGRNKVRNGYVHIDGQRMRVYRSSNGDLVYKRPHRRQKHRNGLAQGY